MKARITFIFLLLINYGFTQQLIRSNIGSLGGSHNAHGIILQSSGGQVATENYHKTGVSLGQGVLQPIVVHEEFNNLEVSIYPNPTSDQIKIGFDSFQQGKIDLKLFASDGTIIFQKQIKETREDHIDIMNYSPGVYHLYLVKGDSNSHFKIVIN